ncbi:hypothetical protein SAY87_004145 [Trapa incisa]|uniref:RING-type E3 ubiquitin transferase n=1 Tax=Trapa incisa TaxID=236973 RepID=A0AAN7PLP4_9MYRT|nr:hypothetical protein SAY87_004145 [Trapa incisa]
MPSNKECVDAELEIDGLNYIPEEPVIFFGPATNVHHCNMPFGSTSANINPHHLHDHNDNYVPYEMTQYSSFHPPTAGSNLGSSSSVPRMSSLPLNFGSTSQISSHGNLSIHEGAYREFGGSNFLDEVGCHFKMKPFESLPGNSCHYSDTSTSVSTNFMGPADARHLNEPGIYHASASYGLPQFGENDNSIALDESSSRTVGVMSDASGINSANLTHNYSNLMVQGGYRSNQSLQQGSSSWHVQQSSRSSIDRGTLGWSPPPAMPLMPANNVYGLPMEILSQIIQRPLDPNGNRSFTNFPHFQYFNMQHYNVPHPSPPVCGIRARNGNLAFHAQALSPLQRAPSLNPYHSGLLDPYTFRPLQDNNSGIILDTTNLRPYNAPRLSVTAVDELLALGELIGNVNAGLSEETITGQLKTRVWESSLSIKLEEIPCEDQEPVSCIICQDAYEDHDKIGVLECGHEYHVECLKKWLLVKNVCPICKSEAFPVNGDNL